MEQNKKYVRKSFWIHQYEQEEAFLSKMAREGWQFVKLHKGLPTKYEFVKGEKVDTIYQLDFVGKEEDTSDYHQLFSDAGWEEVYSWIGIGGKWYYFRRVHTQGKAERIFTDSESKYQMYNKLWKKFGLFLALALFIELNGIRVCIKALSEFSLVSVWGILDIVFLCLFSAISAMLVYWVSGILLERNKIKRRLALKL